jgi:hypothetical protein
VIERNWNMNDIYSSSVVLAHGIGPSVEGGICLLIFLPLFMFGLLIFRKNTRIPKGLFVSSIIPYILVLICILPFYFELQIPKRIDISCFMIVFYSNFLIMGGLGTGAGFFLAAFIIDTLIIFGIIRLILYIKHKISAKKSQMRTSDETN